jgi:hypothetical protein
MLFHVIVFRELTEDNLEKNFATNTLGTHVITEGKRTVPNFSIVGDIFSWGVLSHFVLYPAYLLGRVPRLYLPSMWSRVRLVLSEPGPDPL